VVADKRDHGNRTTEEYKNDMQEARKDGCTEVVITGGEPTIRKDFLELVRYAKSIGFKTIQLQTNGRMFCDREFARKTVEAGVSDFAIALHAHTAEIHDYITRVKGSFDQTVRGIKNLVEMDNNYRLNGIIVVTKFNYKFLPEIAEFMNSIGLKRFQFDFVHPMGNAYTYYEKVVPMASDVAPYMKKGMEVAEKNKCWVQIEAFPFCLIPGYESHAVELYIPTVELRELKRYEPNFNYVKVVHGKVKSPVCKECKYDRVCEGFWREYPEKMGLSEINPIKGDLVTDKMSLRARER
jgi:MoaA/NifB/PqqE/SkfB family radical SAM enzyme